MVLSCMRDMNEFPVKNPKQFGAVLQGFRKDQRLTQKEVGDKVGLAQNAVSQMESDPSRAGVMRLFKLLAALDLEIVVRRRGSQPSKSEW
ncbi:MAG: helix-turn-helix domain-containing protein [Verrucomicrobiales bacterium]